MHVYLQELLIVYQNSPGGKWRAMSTTKVIQAIKKHPKDIGGGSCAWLVRLKIGSQIYVLHSYCAVYM